MRTHLGIYSSVVRGKKRTNAYKESLSKGLIEMDGKIDYIMGLNPNMIEVEANQLGNRPTKTVITPKGRKVSLSQWGDMPTHEITCDVFYKGQIPM